MMIDNIKKAITRLKQTKPVILNITNFVTMDFVANCLLSLGSAPIMSICEDELEELIIIASAIYINIGTLDHSFIDLSQKTVEMASKHHKPIVLDPVGAGATKIRTQAAKSTAPFSSIIRGNASEILALGDKSHSTQGVESANTPDETKEIAKDLACQYTTTIVVSGETDFITDGNLCSQVPYGSSLMSMVTGMGCVVTSIITAFKAIIDDPFEASTLGATYFALCGQIAGAHCKHPGTFKNNLIDQLHKADFDSMSNIIKKQHRVCLERNNEI